MTLVKFNERPAYNHLVENFLNKELFNEFFGKDHNFKGSVPAVNVKETKEGYSLEVAAPGLKKDDFKLEVNHNQLTISAKVTTEKEENEGKYTRKEFSYNSFQRTFTLPNTVDSEKIEAKYVDGVLQLNVPKKEEAKAKPVRNIEIA